jgi:hypothetical protein
MKRGEVSGSCNTHGRDKISLLTSAWTTYTQQTTPSPKAIMAMETRENVAQDRVNGGICFAHGNEPSDTMNSAELYD